MLEDQNLLELLTMVTIDRQFLALQHVVLHKQG
jgi:hypothetical protein